LELPSENFLTHNRYIPSSTNLNNFFNPRLNIGWENRVPMESLIPQP
jgi:hypothetical protein